MQFCAKQSNPEFLKGEGEEKIFGQQSTIQKPRSTTVDHIMASDLAKEILDKSKVPGSPSRFELRLFRSRLGVPRGQDRGVGLKVTAPVVSGRVVFRVFFVCDRRSRDHFEWDTVTNDGKDGAVAFIDGFLRGTFRGWESELCLVPTRLLKRGRCFEVAEWSMPTGEDDTEANVAVIRRAMMALVAK